MKMNISKEDLLTAKFRYKKSVFSFAIIIIVLLICVSNNSFAVTYGEDILYNGGGTSTADSEYSGSYLIAYANDDNASTRWLSTVTDFPHWWKYDFGVGVTKTVRKLTLLTWFDGLGARVKDFTLDGSNDDSDWDTIHTDQMADNGNTQTFTFSNATAYRYYRVNITTNWTEGGDIAVTFFTVEMMEAIDTSAVMIIEIR